MLTQRSTSLPHIKINVDKYQSFYPRRRQSKDLALEQGQVQYVQSEIQKTHDLKKKTHLKNLQAIDKKSTLKSKVEAYLTDSRKMSILDHSVHETRNRRSLTRISLQSMKTVHFTQEQQNAYLTKLKGELNQFTEKNNRAERDIKNCQAMTSQIRQKIIFYEQQLSRSWVERYELLNKRQQNIVHIRYQSNQLKMMQDRLKSVNLQLLKRLKDAQISLKQAEGETKRLNELDCIKKEELDKKQYLAKHYEQFEHKKSESLSYKTDQAIKNTQQNQATQIMRHHQNSINILQPQDYVSELLLQKHQKLFKEFLFHQFHSMMMNAAWSKLTIQYEAYEKAQQMMIMYSLDRNCLVQDSYRKSFQIKKELNQKIQSKEKIMKQLEEKNKRLKDEWISVHFAEIEELQKKVNEMKLQFKTCKKMIKDAVQTETHVYVQQILKRQEEVQRAVQLTIRLKQWVKKEQKSLDVLISKKSSIQDHFKILIAQVHKQLKERESTYTLFSQKVDILVKTKQIPKTNKYGNLKKKK